MTKWDRLLRFVEENKRTETIEDMLERYRRYVDKYHQRDAAIVTLEQMIRDGRVIFTHTNLIRILR